MDSPRGRILLMKEMLEGSLEIEAGLPYVDKCLGCMACVTACPSGVELWRVADAVPGAGPGPGQGDSAGSAHAPQLSPVAALPAAVSRAAAILGRLGRPFIGMLPERMALHVGATAPEAAGFSATSVRPTRPQGRRRAPCRSVCRVVCNRCCRRPSTGPR